MAYPTPPKPTTPTLAAGNNTRCQISSNSGRLIKSRSRQKGMSSLGFFGDGSTFWNLRQHLSLSYKVLISLTRRTRVVSVNAVVDSTIVSSELNTMIVITLERYAQIRLLHVDSSIRRANHSFCAMLSTCVKTFALWNHCSLLLIMLGSSAHP